MKAVGLLSGGLDSTLAIKLIQNQGIEVVAVNFEIPFGPCKKGGGDASQMAKALNIPLKSFKLGSEYLKMVRNPKFGYGKNMNPCIDCKIFMLKKAKKYAKSIGAKFIFTGEVIGQRPMSQHKQALASIEKKAGLEGKIVRPLSAKLLPKTEAEELGYLNIDRLEDIKGRSRKRQIELAKQFNIVNFPSPAGGCLLTDPEYGNKLRDLLTHKKRVTVEDTYLLKFGRHFRSGNNKVIVGRNEVENQTLTKSKRKSDYLFELADCVGPTTVLQGPKTRRSIKTAAGLTAFYSDCEEKEVRVKFGKDTFDKEIVVSPTNLAEIDTLRIKKRAVTSQLADTGLKG